MEILNQRVTRDIDSKQWKPIKLIRQGPLISHLFFADHIFLFGEANVGQFEVMQQILHAF